jgi:hypothetical protein
VTLSVHFDAFWGPFWCPRGVRGSMLTYLVPPKDLLGPFWEPLALLGGALGSPGLVLGTVFGCILGDVSKRFAKHVFGVFTVQI